jgi:8-oxo-dGTP pyrophosphatase MutT (NUDIX family)
MEFLDIVDESGEPTGATVPREEAHRQGILHRTAHVWLIRIRSGKLQVLLQKRSPGKDSYPGCYDISSAGHIPAGDGFLESALRELGEELGIRAAASELIFCGRRRFDFCEMFHGHEFRDSQISNVYALWRDLEPAAFTLQESELSAVLWMDLDSCADMVMNNAAPNCIRIQELEMIASAVPVSGPAFGDLSASGQSRPPV